jgi:elongator complex protein 1
MKNLILLTETNHSTPCMDQKDFILSLLPNPNFEHDDPDMLQHSNPDESAHYILTSSGHLVSINVYDEILWSIDLNSLLEPGEEPGKADADWFHLSYEENSDSLVVLSKSGAILSISLDGESKEMIGCFDYGIQCAAWSADSEILALVTYQMDDDGKIPVIMTMNSQFEILSELPLPHHDLEQSISLCWNKKTDNQLIAVSSHDIADDTRKIRIFEAGSLENIAISRTEDGSGKTISNLLGDSNIAWAGPNTSNLLACVQKKGRKGRNIVFLEPNCLQHGGFRLENRNDHEEVEHMSWNADSDLFAITLVGNADGRVCCKVQFYYRNNYHWYLKYEEQFQPGQKVTHLLFDESKSCDVSIAIQHGSNNISRDWKQYRFAWDTATTSQQGTSAVIDGVHLNLTDFQRNMIPPPMFEKRISFEHSIIGISHVPSYLSMNGTAAVNILVYLNNNVIAFCDSRKAIFDGGKSNKLSVVGTVHLASVLQPGCFIRQCLVVDLNALGDKTYVRVLAVKCRDAFKDELICFTVVLNEELGTHTEIIDSESIVVEGKVLRQVNWSNVDGTNILSLQGSALVELTNGNLFIFKSDLGNKFCSLVPCESESSLLEPCPWISGLATDEKKLIVGMSDRSRLYFGERQLCDAVSSFVLSPAHGFLSYVTLGSRSILRFLPLLVMKDYDPLMGSEENLDVFSEGYESRTVERGSSIVAILPNQPSVILQLPRGNLEGVYPRALVLPYVMTLINMEKYSDALDLMRKQKVDMNLIIDMNPSHFVASGGIRKFIDQVQKADHLNLFIASLQNFDVTEWKYKIPTWLKLRFGERLIDDCPSFDFSSKVNRICSMMRDEMMSKTDSNCSNEGNFLLPILSTYAKETPPKLESALYLIKKEAENEQNHVAVGKKRSSLLSDSAQNSIQYLAFLADYEILFDTALGMYDFELAKAVARNSQMDPKVYIPMLKRLNEIPEFKAKYEIDVRLKRFESALRHLFKLGVPDFDKDAAVLDYKEDNFIKCKEFIAEHQLHELGLDLFTSYPHWHHQLMILFGERLLRENKAELALSIFLTATPKYLDGAMIAARKCGDYRTFFAYFDGDDRSRAVAANDIVTEIASNMSGRYSKRDGHLAGARIYLDYCEDVASAVELLCNAELWFEARRIATLYRRSDLLNQIVMSAVTYAQSCLPSFDSKLDDFITATGRYSEVLKIRREAKAAGYDPETAGDNDETGSLFSLASNASNMSIQSNVSTSTVGSMSSVSSVITAGSFSTFSVTNDDSNRHKSKYNSIGKNKKKKMKKSRRERKGIKPGSEEELVRLVSTLKNSVIDKEQTLIIEETIQFLVQVEKFYIAKELYEAYERFKSQSLSIQVKRIKAESKRAIEEERNARENGEHYERIILDCEKEVNEISCTDFSSYLHSLFSCKIGAF